ncbi:MAG: OB-fold domain-containing protein, partial [Clostridia bacterium]|nr:OB-fold domain-containing protein [Clostridia bacterium]
MISYIKGELTEILSDLIVVETGGVGYNIFVPVSVIDELPSIGDEIK